MLTCFIKNNFPLKQGKYIAIYTVLLIPVLYVLYSLYAFYTIFARKKVQSDPAFRNAILKYLVYCIFYILFCFPTNLLYFLTINRSIHEETTFSYFSYFCALANISVNLVLCLFKIFWGYVKCDWKALFIHADLNESVMTMEGNDQRSRATSLLPSSSNTVNIENENRSSREASTKKRESQWQKFGTSFVKGFMRDFFVGLVLTLNKSKNINADGIIKNKFIAEENKYIFKTGDQELSGDSNIVNIPSKI